jgi:hypothetical protein
MVPCNLRRDIQTERYPGDVTRRQNSPKPFQRSCFQLGGCIWFMASRIMDASKLLTGPVRWKLAEK